MTPTIAVFLPETLKTVDPPKRWRFRSHGMTRSPDDARSFVPKGNHVFGGKKEENGIKNGERKLCWQSFEGEMSHRTKNKSLERSSSLSLSLLFSGVQTDVEEKSQRNFNFGFEFFSNLSPAEQSRAPGRGGGRSWSCCPSLSTAQEKHRSKTSKA